MEPRSNQNNITEPPILADGCLYCGEAADGQCCSADCAVAYEMENK